VEIGSDILRATIVAYYGQKPPQLLDFLGRVQARIGNALGRAFEPYDPRQIHATIVGLEGVLRHDQLLNQNFLTLRVRPFDSTPYAHLGRLTSVTLPI